MTYTLHGRELKVGDKVWNVLDQKWITVNEVHSISQTFAFYAWDECTYLNTIGAIPPPLGWVEGKPVRKGDVLYWKDDGEKISSVTPNMNFTMMSWSAPKRTEQRWVTYNQSGKLMGEFSSETKVTVERMEGYQVFGPFEVEVK